MNAIVLRYTVGYNTYTKAGHDILESYKVLKQVLFTTRKGELGI